MTFLKKIWDGAKEKAVASAIVSMLAVGVTFLVNSGPDILRIPKVVKELKENRNRDSLMAVAYIKRIEILEKQKYDDSVKTQAEMREVKRELRKIKRKLGITNN